uniref:Large ribosomal subunit protein bL31c n=1 Tax=Nitzschia alba TaxID=2858 RepID=A0A5C0F2M7_NITAL|nr:50S ribosomal protein L31 [Nitzschia alba]QEI59614.1 50S ribosomal protein L31 [Nitzschia alba]
MKKNIYINWFTNTIISCDGKPLCTISSTKQKLQINVWLANHSFYKKSKKINNDEDQIEQFIDKYNTKP